MTLFLLTNTKLCRSDNLLLPIFLQSARKSLPFKELFRWAKIKFVFPEATKQAFISVKDGITKPALLTHPHLHQRCLR